MTAQFEHDVIISGIGQSEIRRRSSASPLTLTLDAIASALTDAGLSPRDVGGITTYPGDGTAMGPGFAGPAAADVYRALGMRPDYYMGNYEGPGQLGPVLNACLAISAGLVRHAVVYRTVTEGSARASARQDAGARGATPAWGSMSSTGGGPGPIRYALLARRHFDRYGTTREQLAQIALVARRHAQLNPTAIFQDALTMSDYLSARMIAEPLCLYDCDPHCDGSTAIVLSHASFAPDARRTVWIDALGVAPSSEPEYVHDKDLQPGRRAADQMWGRTSLRPADVDVAGLYDGFTILTMMWLEALGFCARGDSGAFVEGGSRISLGGELPINTQGGQLSGGRLHGLGFVHEVCLQLRGEAGARQVPQAKVGVVAVGAQPGVGCALLRADHA
jgi:acetyl-CoA acetyltransferase